MHCFKSSALGKPVQADNMNLLLVDRLTIGEPLDRPTTLAVPLATNSPLGLEVPPRGWTWVTLNLPLTFPGKSRLLIYLNGLGIQKG
jgi:hypothetical protein